MYTKTIDHFIDSAERRITQLHNNPWGFFVGSLMGGAYIGLGILLILNVGQHLTPDYQKLGMGLTFAIALILITIAGAELFTGYAMYMTFGYLAGRVTTANAVTSMIACWGGNLLGALLVASLFALTGTNGLFDAAQPVLFKIAEIKMYTNPIALLAKAVMCNWLVCLALWMAARVDSDVAKCVVIFWCLLAFIVCGFEHSVANMTLLSLAFIGRSGDPVMLIPILYNLLMVTIGNAIGGGLLVATNYWIANGNNRTTKIKSQRRVHHTHSSQ